MPPPVSPPVDIPQRVRSPEPASPTISTDYHSVVREYWCSTPASIATDDEATSSAPAEASPKPPRVCTHSLTRQKKRRDLASSDAEYVPMVDVHPLMQLTEEMKRRIDRMQSNTPADYELTL